MRLRLFLSFAVVMILTLLILGLVIGTNTETTITSFAQSGGFSGADRIITQYADYYSQTGSWEGVSSKSATTESGSAGSGTGIGQGGGQGRGQGGNSSGNPNSGGGINANQFTLTDENGTVLVSQSIPLEEKLPPEILENSFEIKFEGQIIGYLIPEAGIADLSEIISEELGSALSESILPTALIASAAAILLSIVLTAILTAPIRQLTGAADRIARGNLSQRVPVKGQDEISQLAFSFNQMADSLEEAQKARQSMTADIAHELRTPLSIQRANLEALQDGIYPLTQENLSPIMQQNYMLTKLVEDIHTLVIADIGGLQLEMVNTDLAALITRISEDFQARFDEGGISLTTKLEDSCPNYLLDPSRVSQVIYNVLQNSLRHTPEGGKVEIRTSYEEESFLIRIRDTGEGIPEEALDHLFDRFYRSDQSRSRDKGGSGLGLAIARQIVLAHNGRISAGNHPQGGAVFTIQLPARK